MPESAPQRPLPDARRARQAHVAFRLALVLVCAGFVTHAALLPSWELSRRETTWHEPGPWWSPPTPLRAAPGDYRRGIDWPRTLGRLGGALAGVALVWWLTRDDRTIWTRRSINTPR